MGASCTTMKIGKVIRPVRNNGEETSPPESQTGEEKRKNGSDKKGSSSSRKGSNDTSLHVAVTTNPTSRKHLGSTTEGLEDTMRHTTLNGFTGENWTERSHICDDSMQKKSAHYKKGPLIGKGSSGEVYECLNLNTGELVAIKEIKLYGEIDKMQPTITALLKENVQFRMLNHQNIIKYYETEILEAKDQSHLLIDIALEYVSGGSIKVLVDKFNNLEEKVVSSYTRQILEGLSYLHRNNIVHRNLKATNILIDASGTIKLSDFGTLRFDRFSSEENPQGDNKNSPLKNPVYWLAPEVVMKKALGKPADIWSVGCVALEMLTGSPPWKGLAKNNDELARLITSGTHPNFPSDISESCRDFLMKTLKFKPEDRPTAADLLEHPFIISMSPNNSYLEADTIQSSVIGRPTEYLRNNSNQFFNFKNNDVRVQNFVSNMSTSNLNVSRFLSRGLSNDVVLARLGSTEIVPLTQSGVEEKDDEDRKSSAKASSLIKVQEVSCEDEYTPSATDRQFFPTRPRHVWEQKALGSFEDKEKTEEQDIEKIKAEKRRQLEEEMMRELNQAADQINEALEQDEDEEHSRDYSPAKPVVENYSNSQNSQMLNINSRLHVPVKNPLFTGISFSDFKRSGSNDDNSHPEAMIEASPMVGEDEIAAKFDNLRPDDLGVYWTWDGEDGKEENEIETAKEVKSEKLQESERNSEMGEADNHVAHFGDQYDDMWTPEFQKKEENVKNSNRLIKSDLERFRKAQKKLTERGHTQELEEIEEDNNKKNNNEAQMLEVGEGEGTIYRKQTSVRSDFDLPYSDEIQSRGMRSIEGSQIIMRAVKEAEEVIEASPGFKDLEEGDEFHSNGDIEA